MALGAGDSEMRAGQLEAAGLMLGDVKVGGNEAVDAVAALADAAVGASRELAVVRVFVAAGALRKVEWTGHIAAGMAQLAGNSLMLACQREVGFGMVKTTASVHQVVEAGGLMAFGAVGSKAALMWIGVASRATCETQSLVTQRAAVKVGRADGMRVISGVSRDTGVAFDTNDRVMFAGQRVGGAVMTKTGRWFPSVSRGGVAI